MRLLALTALCASLSAAPLPTGASLGVAPGTPYHFAFVTSNGTLPTSTNIATYDAFVQGAADAAGIGSSIGLNWVVIGSTQTVDAFSHTNVQGPVFLIDGTKLANDSADFWDGNLLTPLNVTELGTSLAIQVYTGTTFTGGIDAGYLGNPSFRMAGYSGYSNAGWIAFGYPAHPPYISIYGISAAITDTETPEPATAWLLAIPLAIVYRRIQRYPAA